MPRTRYVLVLAHSPQQAMLYARRVGLKPGSYRAVSKAKSIAGIQVADVHILPEFHKRFDSHAILAKLRYGRDIVKMDVEMPPPSEAPVVDQGDGMGQQLEIDINAMRAEAEEAIAHALDEAFPQGSNDHIPESDRTDVSNGDDMVSEGGPAWDSDLETTEVEAAEEAPKPRKRRSRCKVCGRLTYADFAKDAEGHDIDAHAPKNVWSD